jgi:hypothetical protein
VFFSRIKRFNWERPKTERKVLVESASKYQAIYLQKLLKEKDKEMKLITNQLIKSNKENVALLKELEGYVKYKRFRYIKNDKTTTRNKRVLNQTFYYNRLNVSSMWNST